MEEYYPDQDQYLEEMEYWETYQKPILEQEFTMQNQIIVQNQNQSPIQHFFNQGMVQDELQKILGQNTSSFTASVVQIVHNNQQLQQANPASIFGSALTAATLNLPINNNLGFAYIVPFKGQAQFQIGYKGFIQLAQRTGQFRRINACVTYTGDSEQDIYQRLTSLMPQPPKGEVAGYVAYFQLHNGFEAHHAMTKAEMTAHAKKYSQTFKNGKGVWATNFDEMAKKTVIKLLLSKQAPLSIDNQQSNPLLQAVKADQAVIIDGQYHYMDNEPIDVQSEPVAQISVFMMTQAHSQELNNLVAQLPENKKWAVINKYPDFSKEPDGRFDEIKSGLETMLNQSRELVA